MLVLIIGIMMMVGLLVGIYLGFKEKYNASEGTCALLVLETFCVSIGLIAYGLLKVL